MGENVEYIKIIKQAQLGNQESLSILAEEAGKRVFVYIYRITLNYHLAQDLSQETILEMLKSIERLDVGNQNSFWSWLYRTALGKVQHSFRKDGKSGSHKKVFDCSELLKNTPETHRSGLNTLVQRELSQTILKAIGKMKLCYRNVLTLRCFDNLSYSEISAITGNSEIQTRLLFFRAKRMLKKQLAKEGFKKENYLLGLGLFGAITASVATKSATAAVAVSAAATKVGIAATVIGTLTTMSGLLSVTAVVVSALFTAGAVQSVKNEPVTVVKVSENVKSVLGTKGFANPTSIIRSCDPDGNGWKAFDYQRIGPLISILPEQLLIGSRLNKKTNMNLVLIIPKDHWVELEFSGEIIDGHGIDVCWDGRDNGKPPDIYIGDGKGHEVKVKSIVCYQEYFYAYGLSGFDISELSLPFKPSTLRFAGTNNGGLWGGTELYEVWARISE